MIKKKITLNTPQDTIDFAKTLAPCVDIGTVLLLTGPLGSGKTFFTDHLCKFLGVEEVINSPTFVLINQYQANFFPVFHIDLYRVESLEEALDLGIEEYPEIGLTIIEWPQLIADIFNEHDTISIDFQYSGNSRSAEIITKKSCL